MLTLPRTHEVTGDDGRLFDAVAAILDVCVTASRTKAKPPSSLRDPSNTHCERDGLPRWTYLFRPPVFSSIKCRIDSGIPA
ncbi:MAG: hypothetical protein IPK13_05205 [Deltaproteobacteria bacterium]|nr:hypothetical protein [Deltaproteobacteria bacterium]